MMLGVNETVDFGYGDFRGVPFVTIEVCSGGIKGEVDQQPAIYSGPELAWDAYFGEIAKFDVLACRVKPELNSAKIGGNRWYWVYSRIAVRLDSPVAEFSPYYERASQKLAQKGYFRTR